MVERYHEVGGQREEGELQAFALRSLELGALLLHELLQVAWRLVQRTDLPFWLLGLNRLFGLLRSRIGSTAVHQLSLHLVHPLFLHHLHTQALTLQLVSLALHEPTTPEVDASSHTAEEEQQDPTVAQQRRRDRNLQDGLVLTHRTILIEHAHMQDITAMMERHIGDIGVLLLSLDPTVAEAFEHIDEARGVMDLTLIGSELDGELILVMAQDKLITLVEGLFEDDATIVLLTHAHLLSEKFQATEDRSLGIVDIGHQLRIDDIDASQSAHEDQAILRTADRTLVVGTLLESVLAAEAAHGERPFTIVLQLRNDVRDTMFGNNPDVMQVVLDETNDTGTEKAAVHIEHRLMLGLRIDNTTASCRTVPDESTTVFNDAGGGPHRCRLTRNGRDRDIGNLATDGVDERIELRVANHQPTLLDPRCLGHEVFGQIGVIGIIGLELARLHVETLHTTTQGTNPDVAPLILSD